MNTNTNKTAATAVAANFDVTELETRHENMWSGGHDDTSIEHATPSNVKE